MRNPGPAFPECWDRLAVMMRSGPGRADLGDWRSPADGGRDAFDQHEGQSIAQCTVGIDHHGPGSRAILESSPCASAASSLMPVSAGNVALTHLGLPKVKLFHGVRSR
jgi:hypothetical protein